MTGRAQLEGCGEQEGCQASALQTKAMETRGQIWASMGEAGSTGVKRKKPTLRGAGRIPAGLNPGITERDKAVSP